jgi:hypothetical protein
MKNIMMKKNIEERKKNKMVRKMNKKEKQKM